MVVVVQGYISGLGVDTKCNFLRPKVLFEIFHNTATGKLSISIELDTQCYTAGNTSSAEEQNSLRRAGMGRGCLPRRTPQEDAAECYQLFRRGMEAPCIWHVNTAASSVSYLNCREPGTSCLTCWPPKHVQKQTAPKNSFCHRSPTW